MRSPEDSTQPDEVLRMGDVALHYQPQRRLSDELTESCVEENEVESCAWGLVSSVVPDRNDLIQPQAAIRELWLPSRHRRLWSVQRHRQCRLLHVFLANDQVGKWP